MTCSLTAADALTSLVEGLREAAAALDTTAERAERLLGRQRTADSWGQVMRVEPTPLVVEEVLSTLEALTLATGRWRRANAQALHAEGWTMKQIAGLYGVSRQRVSALLHSDPPHLTGAAPAHHRRSHS